MKKRKQTGESGEGWGGLGAAETRKGRGLGPICNYGLREVYLTV